MTTRAVLVTDGSSDAVLVWILRWLLDACTPASVDLRWADLRGLRPAPATLSERLARAQLLQPCEVFFVHRDAEAQDPTQRVLEIQAANATGLPHVCVVPVRMTEAWLLFDETALREAAGRPSGREPLELPDRRQWDTIADPKDVLHRALRRASATRGRRAKRFSPMRATHRLAELIDDWSPLRGLEAFQKLEADTAAALRALGLPLRDVGA